MSNTNHQVAHLWFNRSRPSARSSNGNFSFDGDVIYSYRTPIARLIVVDGEVRAVLRTCHRYSVTTSSKHESAITSAIASGVTQIGVSYVGGGNHTENLKYFSEQIAKLSATARRSLQNAEWVWEHVRAIVQAGNQYRRLFNLVDTNPAYEMPADWQECLIKARERIERLANPDPQSADKRERERARRLAKKQENERLARERRVAAMAQQIADWRDGKVGYSAVYGAPVMLRLQPGHDDVLETSLGARVPVVDAIKIFRIAQSARSNEQEYRFNGLARPRVGEFTLDCVDQDGTIKAGCHVIPWGESERMAKALGLLELVD